MAAGDAARRTTSTVKQSGRKATGTAKAATEKTARSTKKTVTKAAATAKATKAAREGRVEDARDVAVDADLSEGMAAKAIAEVDALHYQVEVNKRGLSVNALTNVLNQRWENGWRLAHLLEQRGNTVLVFEKRS